MSKSKNDVLSLLHASNYPYKELASLIRFGNTKLPKTTAIFNMGSATDCPSRKLGFCQAYIGNKCVCYALKAERTCYPDVLPFRRRQEIYWKNHSATDFALSFLMINYFKVTKLNGLRFNEAGDFWGQDCLDKAEEIARILKHYGISVYCYSARKDLDYSKVNTLVVSGSNWSKENVTSRFDMIMDKSEKPKGYGLCIGDCRKCTRCLKKGMKTCIVCH